MAYKNILGCLFVIVSFCHCTLNDHHSFVHVRASAAPNAHRQLVVFMDGTGNNVETRTNVRRLYELTSARHQQDTLTFYDPGVGAGENLLNKAIGGALGLGFQRNIREALTFLAENYRPGDEVSIFGFSRGAYSAGVLATLISRTGLPVIKDGGNHEKPSERHSKAQKAAEEYYKAAERAEKAAQRLAEKASDGRRPTDPAAAAKEWRTAYWTALNSSPRWSNINSGQKIAVLGLWDPVESLMWSGRAILGSVFTNGPKAEFDRHRGHQFHPFALNSNIRECYIAYSLDEQRQAFTAEIPDQQPRGVHGKPGKYEFVWFPGDHSDNGGGYEGDKDIAGLSMNWLLAKVGTRLLGTRGHEFRVYQTPLAPRHDLASGKWYRKAGFRIRGELHPASTEVKIDSYRPYSMKPTGKDLWTMKVHASAIARMKSGHDLFINPLNKRQIDLANEPCGKLNPQRAYLPRPFRAVKVVRKAQEGWVNEDWSADEISGHYEIVQ